MNLPGQRRAKVELKGVFLTPAGRFQAKIGLDGKSHYLGTFDTAVLAARAYDAAAKRMHGKFSRLNFPEE